MDEAEHDRQLRRDAEHLRESPEHPKNLHGREMEQKFKADSDAVTAPGADLIASETSQQRAESVETPHRRREHDESSDSDSEDDIASVFDDTEDKP
jgi:hypothetical protein